MMQRFSFSREPAVWIGFAVSVLMLVQSFVAGDVTLVDFIPAVTGLVTRFFVSPAKPAPEAPDAEA